MDRSARIAVFFVLVSILLTSLAHAQNASVSARLTDATVKLGGDTKLVIEVTNSANAAIGALPDVNGVRFGPIDSPSLKSEYSIRNGVQYQRNWLTWVISVQPQAKGEYTIPPITVDVDGRKLQTRELAFKVVADIQGDEYGLFEIDAPKEVVEGQPFVLEMRFGWDSTLTRQINYAKLSVPWLGGLASLLELDAPPPASGLQTTQLVLNERSRIVAENVGEQKVNGKSFLVLRVRKRFIATRSGSLDLPTSDFEFGHVAQDGFFGRAEAGVSYYKRSPAPRIEVTKLPTEGQPLDFSGAIGSLEVASTIDRGDVDVGDSIKLTVDWTGQGNLEFFTPPDISRLDAFKGFRVYGTNDRKSVERRSVTYDISPLTPDIKEIPPVPLSVFDLGSKSYKTIQTPPRPIRVVPLKNAASLGPEDGARGVQIDIRDIQTKSAATGDASGPSSTVLVVISAAVLAGWITLRRAVRKRGDPAGPRARARRNARKLLARELDTARSASSEARALRTFLSARTGEPVEAWVGRDVVAWADAQRADGEVRVADNGALTALQQLTLRLDESTWNGKDESLGRTVVLETADALMKAGL